jgi:hypothetical protein
MTVEHTRQQIAEAMEGHFEVMREYGEEIPAPARHLDFVVDDDMSEEYCTWVDVEPAESTNAPQGRTATTTKRAKKKKQP